VQRVICTAHRVEVNSVAGLLVRWGGHVEELRRRCGDVVGVKAGAYLIDRFVVNVGTIRGRPPVGPSGPAVGRSVAD
jgi:hypothetical protein